MNFKTADRVASVIEDMKAAEVVRAPNRALINDLYNGVPPYSKTEEDENNILVNINWKEGTTMLHDARRMYESAFLKSGNYFRVNLEAGPVNKRDEWSRIITRNANRPLKRSLPFMEAYRSKFAGVVLHGVGPMAWEDRWKVIPYGFGIEDLLIPTDTYTTFENLYYFAIRKPMKPGELYRKTFGKDKDQRDPGWDMEAVAKILDSYKDLNQNPHQWNFSEHPEKLAELFKQNGTYYDGDSAPVVWFWDFYFQQEEDEGGKWGRRLMLDQDYVPAEVQSMTSPVRFIYESDDFADNLNEILHVQIGDGNNKPPFMYHSIRSVGWINYDVVSMMNRLRCQFTEHVFEQMMMLFRVADPNDRARLEKIVLNNKGIIPEGATIVPNTDRYQIDQNLVNSLMSENKQLMAQATSAYTQDIDDGTVKERTATEVMAQVNSVNALTASLITYAYLREGHAYREIVRRLCIEGSPDPMAKTFREKCIQEGVPAQFLDVDEMDIEPEKVIGGGNKTLEIAQVQQMMSVYNRLDPDAQRVALRKFLGAVLDDEKEAAILVPDNSKNRVTDAIHDADLAFGTLMQGVPMRIRQGLNHIEQTEELLKQMAQKIKMIMGTGGVGTPQDVIGLQNVANYVQQHIQIIAQDKEEKKRARQYSQMLGKLMNFVKGMAQRQQEAAKKQQQQIDPERAQELQMQQAESQQKIASKRQEGQQKMQLKQLEFQANERRKNAELAGKMSRDRAQTQANIQTRMIEAATQPRAFNED